METGFWINTTIYYISIASLITIPNAPAFFVAAIFFFAIPSSTKTELFPGMRDNLNTQVETLKTQIYLNQQGHYQK